MPESSKPKSLLAWLKVFGPGVVTGAADDDPSGIAIYSQAGARFGMGLLWIVWLMYPLMVAIQEIAARVGRVTGHGLGALPRGLRILGWTATAVMAAVAVAMFVSMWA